VVAKWAKKIPFDHIYIVDDDVVNDTFICQLMKSIAPKNLTIVILDVDDAAASLTSDAGPDEKICIITKLPQVFERLLDAGVPIKEVMLGGMGNKSGRTPLIRSVSASPEERASLKRLIGAGVRVFYQDVPDTKPTDLLKKL
jgi:PTS system mannose-specific IIB component